MSFDYVSANQTILHKKDCLFPFDDMGFLYGYGLFETVRVHRGRPLLFSEHFKRLKDVAIILDIPFNFIEEDMHHNCLNLIYKNKAQDAVMNVYLTPGDRDFLDSSIEPKHPFLLIVLRPFDSQLDEKRLHVSLREESFKRTKMDRFKSMNYLKNILEKKLVHPFDNVLLFDEDHMILESPTANVFFVQESTLISPDSECILPGVVRQFVMDHADKFGMNLVRRPVHLSDLEGYDEVFFTNSVYGVIEIERLETLHTLCSGIYTTRIREMYNQLIIESMAGSGHRS